VLYFFCALLLWKCNLFFGTINLELIGSMLYYGIFAKKLHYMFKNFIIGWFFDFKQLIKMRSVYINILLLFLTFSSLKAQISSPVIVNPQNNSLTYNRILIDWNAVVGVDFYELEIDTIDTFNSAALVTVIKEYISSSNSNADTRHTFIAANFNQTYFFRV
jgi:hypothetical protein